MKKIWLYSALIAGAAWLNGCNPEEPAPTPSGDLLGIPYNPQSYSIKKPAHFPVVAVPADNPMTVEGVQLGRRLFYDPILSGDSSISCSSCHLPQGSFTDNKAVSKGVGQQEGTRSAMSLLNIAYVEGAFFWDGRSPTLEDQAIHPVEDPIEMHANWTNVVERLKAHPTYPALFRKAFGINDRDEITKELTAKAIAQFERILISSGTSKYDQYLAGNNDALDDEEEDGRIMYFDAAGSAGVVLPDGQCFHCHGNITMNGGNFFNNGLDSVASLSDFKDKGRFKKTGNPSDQGKFRAPTLRNIALSAPYMHDGRFQTMEEVLDQYSDNGSGVSNEDPFIRQIGFPLGNGHYSGLTPYQKQAIIKFLHTLTDTTFVNNPDIQSPF